MTRDEDVEPQPIRGAATFPGTNWGRSARAAPSGGRCDGPSRPTATSQAMSGRPPRSRAGRRPTGARGGARGDSVRALALGARPLRVGGRARRTAVLNGSAPLGSRNAGAPRKRIRSLGAFDQAAARARSRDGAGRHGCRGRGRGLRRRPRDDLPQRAGSMGLRPAAARSHGGRPERGRGGGSNPAVGSGGSADGERDPRTKDCCGGGCWLTGLAVWPAALGCSGWAR